jgi:hypothetical protein
MLNLKTINRRGAASLSRVLKLLEVHDSRGIPWGKYKVKLLERDNDFIALPNVFSVLRRRMASCLRRRARTSRHPGVEAANVAFGIHESGRIAEQVVETASGFHVLKLIGRDPAYEPRFEKLREPLRKRIATQSRVAATEKLTQEIWKSAAVRIDKAALNQLQAKPKVTAAAAPLSCALRNERARAARCPTRSADRSARAASGQHHRHGPEDEAQVLEQRPMIDVPHVQVHPLIEGDLIPAAHLPNARQAGPH